MHHHQPIIGQRNIEKTRRTGIGAGLEIETLVDLVGQYPGSGLAAMLQNALLLQTRQRPAGRIVGRVNDQHFGGLSHCSQQTAHVKCPDTIDRFQWHALELRSHDDRLCRQVGPYRGDCYHFVTRVNQLLHRQHQRIDATTGDGNPIHANLAMTRAHVSGDFLAQFGQAQVMRIEGFAALQGINCRLADEVWCDLIAFPEPEGQHIAATHAGIGDFPDSGLFKVLDD